MDSRPSREPRTKAGLVLLNLIREPLIYGVTDRMDLSSHYESSWAIRDGICAIEDALAALPSEPPSDPTRLREAVDILDVIDGIVDDTHPEGDGCPLCVALDDLREALAP